MFSITFFVICVIATCIIDGKKGNVAKSETKQEKPQRKVVGGLPDPKKFFEKTRIESSGLKIYSEE
jgi:hypothetical protein